MRNWPQISTLCLTLTCPAVPRPQLSSKSHFSYPAISPKYKFRRKGRGGKPHHRHNRLCLREREEAWCHQKEDYRKPWDKQTAKLSQRIQTQMRSKRKKKIKSTALCIIFCNVRTCRERIVFGCFQKPLPTLIKAFRKLRKRT